VTPKYPTRFQSKTIWRALTGIAILVIGILIVGLIWLTGKTLGYLQPVLVPLAVAGIVAYLLDPIVSWLQTRGLSRLKAVITVFASFVILLTALGFLIAPPIAKQISDAFHDKEEIARKATTAMTEVKDAPWLKPLINYASEKVNPETGATHIEPDEPNTMNGSQEPATTATELAANTDVYAKPDYQYRWQFLISKYATQIAKRSPTGSAKARRKYWACLALPSASLWRPSIFITSSRKALASRHTGTNMSP